MIIRLLTGCIALLLGACTDTGYIKEEKKWYWVTSNAGGVSRHTIKTADDATFEVLGSGFAKDKRHVYWLGDILKKADPSSFEIINSDRKTATSEETELYTRDKNQVFLEATPIPQADPSSFQILTKPFSKDNKHVYLGNVPLPVQDIDSFEVISSASASTGGDVVGILSFGYPEYYELIDTHGVVVYSSYAKSKTKTQQFEGIKEIVDPVPLPKTTAGFQFLGSYSVNLAFRFLVIHLYQKTEPQNAQQNNQTANSTIYAFINTPHGKLEKLYRTAMKGTRTGDTVSLEGTIADDDFKLVFDIVRTDGTLSYLPNRKPYRPQATIIQRCCYASYPEKTQESEASVMARFHALIALKD